MIPLRDSIPRVHTPYAVYGLILVNTLIFFYTQSLGGHEKFVVFHLFGVVPLRFSEPLFSSGMGYPDMGLHTFVTYMFLHGGWMHFLLNMWSLWIFADNIEDVMGPWRFLLFYCVCGVFALGVQYVFDTGSMAPVVGASGAIAGVMGAYFLLYPHAKVSVLIPIVIIPFVFEVPAILFLGLWFVTQFFSGLWAMGSQAQGGGVAWWAHAGGFLAGMLLLPVFKKKGRCYFCRPAAKTRRGIPGFGRR